MTAATGLTARARSLAARTIGDDDGTAEYAASATRALRASATLAAFHWAGEWARRLNASAAIEGGRK